MEVQSVKDGRCYWGVGPEWTPYKPTHGGVIVAYSLYWTGGAMAYVPQQNTAQTVGSKLFVAYTGGGGPAPCGAPDPHQGGRFPSLAVKVTVAISYPAPTTTAPPGDTVTGEIQYYYASGDGFARGVPGATQLTPSRDTQVDVLDASKGSCGTAVLNSVDTDETGHYTTTVPPRQQYVCVKILAVTPYSEVLRYPSAVASSATNGAQLPEDAYATKALGPMRLASSTATKFSWKPKGVEDPLDQALDIQNALVTGANWLAAYGASPKFLNILYPYPASKEISNFSASKTLGEINRDDAFDWGVLLHEYGHFIGSLIGIDNTTPVRSPDHFLFWNMSNHEADRAQGLAIAWNEGFADFFSQMVQRAMGTASLGLSEVGGSPPIYIDHGPTGTVSLRLDVPGDNSAQRSLGEDNEASVARVLWALYSQPSYEGLDGSVAFVKTLSAAMTANESRTLSGAVTALLAAVKASPWVPNLGSSSTNAPAPGNFNEATSAGTYGAILSSQNVAPQITASAVSSSGTSLSLTWRAGQPATANDRLNMFLVQFWSSSWATLLSEQIVVASVPGLDSGSEVFRSTTSIPSSWQKASVNAVVLGWTSSTTPDAVLQQLRDLRAGPDPVTGPYISAPVSLKIG